MKHRGYNFGASQTMLPTFVLESVQTELLNWEGQGLSILELGHRTPEFMALMQSIENDFRDLLHIPEDYCVLFLGGAARSQFGMIPFNWLQDGKKGAYLVSGFWSHLAYTEAVKIKPAYCVASSEKIGFRDIPARSEWQLQDNTAYLYYTANETIHGTYCKFPTPIPDHMPVVVDMTSCILSEPIAVNDYGLIFAGGQKNLTTAGLTVVILRKALLDSAKTDSLPTMLAYATHAKHHSLYATPPVFNCYLAGKMLQWIKAQGGVETLHRINRQKASLLYDYLDTSSFYRCHVANAVRSTTNVCFTIDPPHLEAMFVARANDCGLLGLQGHRVVGGLRASLYNAMPLEGVYALLNFMEDFAKEHAT